MERRNCPSAAWHLVTSDEKFCALRQLSPLILPHAFRLPTMAGYVPIVKSNLSMPTPQALNYTCHPLHPPHTLHASHHSVLPFTSWLLRRALLMYIRPDAGSGLHVA